jgi:hypothetical protein
MRSSRWLLVRFVPAPPVVWPLKIALAEPPEPEKLFVQERWLALERLIVSKEFLAPQRSFARVVSPALAEPAAQA